MKRTESPDYRRIYNDIIKEKYPEKKELCKSILEKKELSFLDIIKLNSLLFEEKNKERSVANQRHKSYNISTIREILDYQRKNKLNNTQLAIHFKLSRNSIAKWNKLLSSNDVNIVSTRIADAIYML
ncbi:helix-turn-helix domain-containing protein [Chryseobacterium viscerum]|uniref:Helix-turn-helix domain-containing protein n=1 Tax=Chryseobacterium viscerum TaxID=1037377 RepID=A0A5N4BM63_9FLAO|nr:helix-turn-helix domain-containing protein [Chryseobacterium viscerum]KAB1229503.1 helix-turn-helix domain-containing protein [Chryseobacterium viscerum]